MEASPFGFTLERYWTEEKERALIAFFSKHSCLWNHKSESYKNRQLRWRTLEELRVLLSAQPPPVRFTVEDIKNKFKNLRTTFQRQYKMVKMSKVCRSDDVFVPQWKHYQQLMFLQGCGDQDEGPEGPEDPPPSPLSAPQEEGQPAPAPPGPTVSCLQNPSTSSPMSSTSCVLSNMMVKCFWTEERERELIAFYSEHSCLWNKKSENRNNRQLKLRLLEALRSQLSDQSVTFSVEDVKCKFKNLRTVFNREHKAVQQSRASDKLYASKWKHYHQLLFLSESYDEDDGPDEPHTLTTREDKDGDHKTRSACSALSSFTSSCTQTNISKFSSPSAACTDAKTSSDAAYQIFLSAPTDLGSPTAAPTLPASPSTSTPDPQPCTNPSASAPLQPDCRLSSDSRCHWSEAKVQQLISFYCEHSCLWNHRSESYRNRLLRQNLLETLSCLMSDGQPVPFTVEDIKTKFRNLRTIFQREHKAVSSNKTCGSEDFYLPKWKHYSDLMFLCDSCDEEEKADELQYHQVQEAGLVDLGPAPSSSLHYHSASQTATKHHITAERLEAAPSPTPPDSRRSSPSSSPSMSSSHADWRSSGRKRASRSLLPSTGELLDFMRTLYQSQMASPHAGFLKYVEECLNETPPDKVKKLKKMIIETIHSVSTDV